VLRYNAVADTTETVRPDREPELARARAGLVVIWPPSPEVHPLRDGLVLGREPPADLVLRDNAVSRRHARMARAGGGWTIEDLGSHNSTFVDGQAVVASTPVAHDSLVRLGSTLLLLVEDIETFHGWCRDQSGDLVGGSAIDRLREFIARFAEGALDLLVVGETGTGKELVARAIHAASGLHGPLVPVNCAAVPQNLFESAFFGHRRGSFTGATQDALGYFRAASGGTLFLDEVGELPLEAQAKLLRAIEQREVQPVGAGAPERVQVRVVAATHKNLEAEVIRGGFRRDFYERLGGVAHWIPPLRDRREDIVLLVRHFLSKYESEGPPGAEPTVETLEALALYGWPGNVRELERTVRELLAHARTAGGAELRVSFLPERIRGAPRGDSLLRRIEEGLRAHGGNVLRAAEALGIARSQIYATLQRHGRTAEEFRDRSQP